MNDKNTTFYGSGIRGNPIIKIYLIIGLVAVVVEGSMGYISYLGDRMVATRTPLIDASVEIRLEATTGHLWLEELIGGDQKENSEDIMKHFDQADWYAKAMINGGQSAEGKFIPLKNPELRHEIEGVREKLHEFKEISRQRLLNPSDDGIGSGIDQRSDGVFRDFVLQADRVETQLQRLIGREYVTFRIVQTMLIVICLAATLLVGIVFSHFVHVRIRNEAALQATNQQLSASEQQLRATNQQLYANEQQLRAANQQLSANEQQLRAANQQLSANEQQLRAANQQLRAHEQQLKASNDQLAASEQQLKATNQQLAASEQELRREKDKIKRYLDIAGVMLAAIDHEQRVDLINKKGCEILGYDEDEILSKNWFECFIPERLREQVGITFNMLISGEIEPVEYYENTVLTKDGRERLISWHNTILENDEGRIVGTLSSGEDITEKRRAEENERIAAERLGLSIKNMLEGYVMHEAIFDDDGRMKDFRYVQSNPAAQRILGIPREKVIGKTAQELFPNVVKRGLMDRYADLMATGEPQYIEDFYYKGDHLDKVFDISCFRLDKKHFVCIFRDVTERKVRERELADYRNKLRSLVSELTTAEDRERRNIASLLHDDVLQKLALSKMKLSMLRETLTSDEQLGALDDVHGYVSEMFEDMRSLTFDLCPPILYDIGLEAAVRDWLQKEMAEKYEISVNLETRGQPLRLSEDLRVALYRAIREVLMNVIKHARAQKVDVTLTYPDQNVKVEVKDDGIGFEQAAAETDEESSSGLGLFTVRERLEYFGGALKTESAPGKGTRVVLTAALTDRDEIHREA